MATKQELQLEILNPEYSRFVKDQVLTEVQLNEILDFFEDQHRLTRTCLIGTGIVCGLNLWRKGNTVNLSPGVALTTDGDLLKMGAMKYQYFTKYTPPENSHYDPFYYTSDSKDKMVTLYQLLTEEEKQKMAVEDVHSIENLDALIKNWVAILYLEYYLKDPEKCTPTNCDNLGMRQVAKPKLLILSKDDMDKIIHKDEGEKIGDDIYLKYHDAYDKYFTFPVIKAKRVILNQFNTLKSNTLAGAYFKAAKEGSSPLADAILDLYNAFKFLVDKSDNLNMKAITGKLVAALTRPADALTAQYTYDFYKDVVQAYNELREVLYNVAFECCPNLYAFPKHIMLGEPNVQYGPKPPDYRHQFYPSPAVSKNKVMVNVAIGMLDRLKLMIENFDPQPVDPIRITPSRDNDQKLEERAIPFYYQKVRLLSKEWSYNKALKGQDKLNLAYHAPQYDPPVRDEVLNPLDYDIDPYNFFRIEGHIGKDFKAVLKQLDALKSSKGIPMDVVAVRLGDVKLSDINLEDFECHFEDLNTMLRAFQVEISCLLADSTSFFSGFTPRKELPHINLQRYIAVEGQPKWIIHESLLKSTLKGTAFTAGISSGEARTGTAGETAAGAGRETFSRVTRDARILDAGRFTDAIKGDAFTGVIKDPGFFSICDPFIKPVFPGDRIVKTRIDLNPETFGKYYLKALENESLSVDDFMEKARQFASEDVELNKLDEDERFVAFEYPMQIIGHLNYVQRYVPSYLGDISDKMITDYRGFSQVFCKRLKVMHTRLERYFKTGNYVQKGYENMYINMLDNLERICCGNEKLEVILREIEKRKAEILKSLSFARYAEQHPGLEHKAGVHRGGTFVIVYAGSGNNTDPKRSFRDFLEKRRAAGLDKLTDAEITGLEYRDPETFAYYVASNEDVLDKEAELSRFLAFQKVPEGSFFSERLIREVNDKIAGIRQVICRDLNQPERDIVIADFCLPYLCCSDCPPVAFIIPKDRKQLALPVDRACSDQEPIAFSAYFPKGAVIGSAEAPDAIIAGDSPAFDPRKVPVAQIGKTITFTLDGEATDCAIVVKSPVAIDPGFKLSDTGGNEFTVEFLNNTDESASGPNTYLWKFNDRRQDIVKPDKSPFSITFSRKQLNEQNIATITVKVNIQDDPCNSNGTLSIPVPAEEVIDECPALVLSFIKQNLANLNSPGLIRRVRATGNTQVQDIYTGTLNLFEAATEVLAANDPRMKFRLMVRIDDLLKQIYQIQLIRVKPDVHRILEELLRALLMLLLNMVRCDAEIPGNIKEVLGSDLGMFHELAGQLAKKFPQLDLANVLEKEVREFTKNFKSQDPNILGMLKVLIDDLKNFPEA